MAKDFIDLSILSDFDNLVEVNIGGFGLLKYPKFIPMMKMKVNKYKVTDFGYIMVMRTSMLNLMKLTTISFTPNGVNVPFLLIDTMSMGKKRLAYVEFYNTSTKDEFSSLFDLEVKYKDILNYNEKDAWYVKERMKGSLIKCGSKQNEKELANMIKDAIRLYKNEIDKKNIDINSISNLKEFREKMINMGNPSSNTLNKVLGKNDAVTFFKEIVMPIDEK